MGIRRNKTWLLFPVEPNKWVWCQIKGSKGTRSKEKELCSLWVVYGSGNQVDLTGHFHGLLVVG